MEVTENPQDAKDKTFRFDPGTQDSGIPEIVRPRGAARELNNLLSTYMRVAGESYDMTESRRHARLSLASLKRIYENCREIVNMNDKIFQLNQKE